MQRLAVPQHTITQGWIVKLFGRPLQDTIPAHHRAFAPEWQRSVAEADERAKSSEEQVESYYNLHARPLPEIMVGSNVAVQNQGTKRWDIYGVVIAVGRESRDFRYLVRTGSRRILVRNRRFLRRRVPLSPPIGTDGVSSALPAPGPPSPPVCRSTRPRNKTRRLIEEITF